MQVQFHQCSSHINNDTTLEVRLPLHLNNFTNSGLGFPGHKVAFVHCFKNFYELQESHLKTFVANDSCLSYLFLMLSEHAVSDLSLPHSFVKFSSCRTCIATLNTRATHASSYRRHLFHLFTEFCKLIFSLENMCILLGSTLVVCLTSLQTSVCQPNVFVFVKLALSPGPLISNCI